MKKLLVILLSLALVVSMVACNSDNPQPSGESTLPEMPSASTEADQDVLAVPETIVAALRGTSGPSSTSSDGGVEYYRDGSLVASGPSALETTIHVDAGDLLKSGTTIYGDDYYGYFKDENGEVKLSDEEIAEFKALVDSFDYQVIAYTEKASYDAVTINGVETAVDVEIKTDARGPETSAEIGVYMVLTISNSEALDGITKVEAWGKSTIENQVHSPATGVIRIIGGSLAGSYILPTEMAEEIIGSF